MPGPVGQSIAMPTSTTDAAPGRSPAVSCSNCPAICCQLKVILIAGDDPPQHFIDLDEDGQEIMGKGDDGWCAALDREAMRCSIYERRPFVCREFAMGGGDCIDEREKWRRIAVSLR
jgi:Fe-S-cluster containining protein